MIDVIGFVKTFLEQRANYTVLDGIPIRGGRLEREDVPPALLLEPAGALRHESLPAYLPFRVALTAYGRTDREASEVYATATGLLHRAGKVVIDGVAMWDAFDETGPSPRDDASTSWPATYGVVALYMPDVAIDQGGS